MKNKEKDILYLRWICKKCDMKFYTRRALALHKGKHEKDNRL